MSDAESLSFLRAEVKRLTLLSEAYRDRCGILSEQLAAYGNLQIERDKYKFAYEATKEDLRQRLERVHEVRCFCGKYGVPDCCAPTWVTVGGPGKPYSEKHTYGGCNRL